MAEEPRLDFVGTRWAGARVVSREELPQDDLDRMRGHSVTYFKIATTGRGRKWVTRKPLGFWRTFGEGKPHSEEFVLDILRRHGDPAAHLDRGLDDAHTADWLPLATVLNVASKAWLPPEGNSGVSRLSDDPELLKDARLWLCQPLVDDLLDKHMRLRTDRETGGQVRTATSLAAFMLASASRSLVRRAAMRRCLNCGDWFIVERSDARMCGGACRSLYNNARRAG